MTETTVRSRDGNGHTPEELGVGFAKGWPDKCPYSRHFSYATCQYTIAIGYAELTEIIEGLDDLWQRVEDTHGPHEVIGDAFAAILGTVDAMREWTGWGGIPGKYTGETGPGVAQ